MQANPEKERVEGKERAIIEDASTAKDGSDCCRCRGCSRENEFGAVTHTDNVRVQRRQTRSSGRK